MSNTYKAGSLTLIGTVAMGTGVMIGAGIFALTGQVAELAGRLFPLAFLLAAIVSGVSAYSYIKVTRKYPSAGGIAMILQKAYGPGVATGAAALLMGLSMIINESLVARTFGAYTLQFFNAPDQEFWIPILAVGLIVFAFLVNIAGNNVVGGLSKVTAALKVGGILIFAGIALWSAGFDFQAASGSPGESTSLGRFVAAVALAILAFKGFTTITNSGDEVVNPQQNVGRAIVISLIVCLVVYLLVSYAVGSVLTIDQIVAAKDYSLAEAARPAIGGYGVEFTVALAIIATTSGLIASVFAVSRMLAMLTDMKLIPHRHFRMPGTIQTHTLVYTVVMAALLAVFFDLSRIASLGAIFYLVMDFMVHLGIFRHLRKDVDAHALLLISAMCLDLFALIAFLVVKGSDDPLIVIFALVGVGMVFVFEYYYLRNRRDDGGDDGHEHE
jgi:amino acid transporter